MKLIGLEINDAGLTCVDPNGRRRPAEASAASSPGFALRHGRKLIIGTAAQQQARRQPRQINSRFWDDLNDQRLKSPEFKGFTHAELAYRHLKKVWQQIGNETPEVVITVPDHYQDGELGLLLGIATALGMPVRGLISQALACVPRETGEGVHIHVDIHLHRLALTAVDGRPYPVVCRQESLMESGLETIHGAWIKILADAFVRQTRFDPLYAAEAEQTLHDRLPGITTLKAPHEPILVAMQADGRTHQIELERDALQTPYASWIRGLADRIALWQEELGASPAACRLLVAHRVVRLPGFVHQLENATGLKAHPLVAGTAATNALTYSNHFSRKHGAQGVPFLNRLPQPAQARENGYPAAPPTPDPARPTHLLYRGWAYPITDTPLVVGRELPAGTRGIAIQGQLAGISRRHFSVRCEAQEVFLTDTSRFGTRVEEAPVNSRTRLQVGQIIRIGTPGETLQAIACLPDHETTIA